MNIPSGWINLKLSDIGNLIRGVSYKKEIAIKETRDEYIPIFRSNNIDKILLYSDLVYLPKSAILNEQMISCGDILISMSSGSKDLVGKAAQADKNYNTAFGTFCGLVRLSNLINKKYIGFYFQSKEYRDSVSSFSSGISINNLRREHIENLRIRLAPINEQNRIVEKIEELFTKLDAGVAALEKVRAQLKRYRQAVLKAAFSGQLTAEWRQKHSGVGAGFSRPMGGFQTSDSDEGRITQQNGNLPDLPKGWELKTINELGDIITGTTPSKSNLGYYGNDFPFYKPTDLNYGYYVRNSVDGLSKEGIKKGRYLPEKSVLVTCIGATIGKTGLIRKAGSCNQQINAIVPKESILPEYVYFICTSPQFQKTIFDNASSTTLPILNKGKFGILPFPLPTIEEQHQIVSEIERRFSVADEVEKTIINALKQARRLRQSILKMAFEGKLVPQDPNDEPAEKLLERIRAEKAVIAETKKMRKKK